MQTFTSRNFFEIVLHYLKPRNEKIIHMKEPIAEDTTEWMNPQFATLRSVLSWSTCKDEQEAKKVHVVCVKSCREGLKASFVAS